MSVTESYQAEVQRRQPRRRTWLLLALIGLATLLVGGLNLLGYALDPNEPGLSNDANVEGPPPPTFVGLSTELKQTKVLPALASPLDKNQSAVWCGTMGLAWKKFAKEMKQGKIMLVGAEELCELLHQEPPVELSSEHYYVNAGWYKDGILERIRGELAEKFPNAPSPPEPRARPAYRVGLAYAYLDVVFKYQFQFKQNDKALRFIDGAGKKTDVKSFGIREKDHGPSGYRGQVKVLFRQKNEFALDLSSSSKPYQLIVARMPPQATLATTLAELDRRCAAASSYGLGNNATVLIPTCSWRLEHRFRELEGKFFARTEIPEEVMDEVVQMIDFRMDHRGVVLKSTMRASSTILNGDGEEDVNPDHFFFDRPYFVVLKKRDGRPFFVFWVANAELLTPY
jgi:hypothetical protein